MHALFLLVLLMAAVMNVPPASGLPVEISNGRMKLHIDPERGGVVGGLWYDLNGDGLFSSDELMLDTGHEQGLVLEVLEIPQSVDPVKNYRAILSAPHVAGRLPAPRESWYQGETYRLTAVSDSVWTEGEHRVIVLGRFFRAGIWPYRIEWELAGDGTVQGMLQLLPDIEAGRPSGVRALGMDLRFHYRNDTSFHRRAVHAGVDQRIWAVHAEEVRWWDGVRSYNAHPETYGYKSPNEIAWPDFNIVSMVQNSGADCRLWKAMGADVGNLTPWRGTKSRGWLHIEDRVWGLGYGITDMAVKAPASLTADMDAGELSAALQIRFRTEQGHWLDTRGPEGTRLTEPHRFFLAPNSGRWQEAQADALDRAGIPVGGVAEVEPDPEQVKFSRPQDIPESAEGTVAFRIDEPAGIERTSWPVTVGVPFHQGAVASLDALQFQGPDGAPVPYQAEALAYWPDNSIKWGLFDAQVNVPKTSGAVFSLTKGNRPVRASEKVTAAATAGGVRVETGPLAFEIDRDGAGFIDRAWLDINADGVLSDGEMVVDQDDARRNILDYIRTDAWHTGEHDVRGTLDESEIQITNLAIERSGPLRAVILVQGFYNNRLQSPFTLRLEAYAGKPWVRVQHTFTYTLNPQAEFVHAMGLRLPLVMGQNPRVAFSGQSGAPVMLSDNAVQGELLQEHLHQAAVWEAQQNDAAVTKAEVFRPAGWCDISNGRWGVTVAVQNFWQEFAKGIAVDKESNSITAWFWPPEAAPLDLRRYSHWMYPQVGETVEYSETRDLRNFGYATGLAKTSTAVFAFHTGGLNPEHAESIAKGFQDRPLAVCSPRYYGEAGIAGPFAAYDAAAWPKLERTFTDICDWFLFNRQRFSWYGLVDYGDIGHMARPAMHYEDDESTTFRDGWAYDIGRWGWTNSEGQDALGFLMSFFHTGYRPYFDAGAIAAIHNQDIDVYHWGPFKNMGHTRHNVNHWGDGDFEIRISQPSHNRFYYYLTGDPRSRDIIESAVDDLFATWTIGHTADLGAILYGFLVRWEMTGDPVWRDKALAVCHAYGDFQGADGGLPSHNIQIEAATGRRLNEPDPKYINYSGFFPGYDFGSMHAMVELQQLTGDGKLLNLLHQHARYFTTTRFGSYRWNLLSLALAAEKSGEQPIVDRILTGLSDGGYDAGLYPRDRRYWTGEWGDNAQGAGAGVHPVITGQATFTLSQIPAVLRVLKELGVTEDRIPAKTEQ